MTEVAVRVRTRLAWVIAASPGRTRLPSHPKRTGRGPSIEAIVLLVGVVVLGVLAMTVVLGGHLSPDRGAIR